VLGKVESVEQLMLAFTCNLLCLILAVTSLVRCSCIRYILSTQWLSLRAWRVSACRCILVRFLCMNAYRTCALPVTWMTFGGRSSYWTPFSWL